MNIQTPIDFIESIPITDSDAQQTVRSLSAELKHMIHMCDTNDIISVRHDRMVGVTETTLLYLLFLMLKNPNQRMALIGHNRTHSRDALRRFKQLTESTLGSDDIITSSNDAFTLANMSSIHSISSNLTSLRGMRYTLIVIDQMWVMSRQTQLTILNELIRQETKLIFTNSPTYVNYISVPKSIGVQHVVVTADG